MILLFIKKALVENIRTNDRNNWNLNSNQFVNFASSLSNFFAQSGIMNKMTSNNQQSQLQPHPHVNNKFFMNPADVSLKNLSNCNNTSPRKGSASITNSIKEERFEDENLYKTLNDSLNLNDNSSMNLKLPLDILENSNNYILNLSNSNATKSIWNQSNKQTHILNNVLNSINENGNDSLSAGIGYPFNFNPNNSFDMQQDTHTTIHTPPLKTNTNFINHFGSSQMPKNINNQNHQFQHLFNQNRTNTNNSRKSNHQQHHHHHHHHQNQSNTNNPLFSSKSYNVESEEEEDFVNWDNLL